MDIMQLIQSLVWLMAGIGVFITGMNLMGDGLEKSAGSGMKKLLEKVSDICDRFFEVALIEDKSETAELFGLYDTLLTQRAVLSAMLCSAAAVGSHGSAFVDRLPPSADLQGRTTRTLTRKDISERSPVSPMPNPELWFETLLARQRKEN